MNPSDHHQWMNWAIRKCTESLDPSVQNGAILVDPNGILVGHGHNGLTYGIGGEDKWERPAKYMWVEHAERNAIYNAAFWGMSLDQATLYCPWLACHDCARAIVMSGITRVVRFPMGEADGWQESIQVGEEILNAAGVDIVELNIEDFDIPEGLRLGQFREV